MNPKFDITRFCPCKDGLEYYNGHSSFEQAWNDCPRGDWMLWIAKRLAVDPRVLTKAKALCANTVRHLMTDKRSTAAVDAALLYADGKITEEELQKYACAAAAAADAAYSYADAADAYAAANAADANAAADDAAAAADDANAAAAAYAANAAAYAAADADAAAAAAANYYAANAARAANRKETAKICREILTEAVFEKTNK
jgi:hypothetical protein